MNPKLTMLEIKMLRNTVLLDEPFLTSISSISSFHGAIQVLKNLAASENQTRIIGAEIQSADHLTTTTGPNFRLCDSPQLSPQVPRKQNLEGPAEARQIPTRNIR